MFLTNNEHEAHISVTTVIRRPQAVVVALGGTPGNAAVCDLYHEEYCNTVCATAPPFSWVHHNTEVQKQMVACSIREACRLLKAGEWSEMGYGKIPVIIHVMGYPGAQLLEHVQNVLTEFTPIAQLRLLPLQTTRRSFSMKGANVRKLLVSNDECSTSATENDDGSITTVSLAQESEVKSLSPNLESEQAPSASGDKNKHRALLPQPPHQDTIITSPQPSVAAAAAPPPPFQSRTSSSAKHDAAEFLRCLQHCKSSSPSEPPSRNSAPPWKKQWLPRVQRTDRERINREFNGLPKYNDDDNAEKRDFQYFKSRLSSIVFDSAPYIPTPKRELDSASHLIHHGPTKFFAQTTLIAQEGWNAVTSMFATRNTTTTSTLSTRPERFWKRMMQLDLCKRHVFLHSRSGDHICDYNNLTKMMGAHHSRGVDVLEFEFPQSGHCQHHEVNPSLYTEFLKRVLTAMEAVRLRPEENQDEGWWSDDEQEGHEILKSKDERDTCYHVMETTGS